MCCYFYFKSLSERAIIIALTFIKEGYLDKLNLGNLSSIIYFLSLYCNTP